MVNLSKRFNEKWKEGDGGCWIWQGARSGNGYGSINTGKHGKSAHAHRVSYELHIGPIPDGLCVCHTCDNRACVCPDHLFLGTNADNIADSMQKGRRKGVTRNRPSGLTYKKQAPRTAWWKDRVVDLLACGVSQRQAAKHLGLSQSTISVGMSKC